MNCRTQRQQAVNVEAALENMTVFIPITPWNLWVCECPHQEPVDVHEQQGEEKSVEEEVEGDVGDGLKARHAGGIQNF